MLKRVLHSLSCFPAHHAPGESAEHAFRRISGKLGLDRGDARECKALRDLITAGLLGVVVATHKHHATERRRRRLDVADCDFAKALIAELDHAVKRVDPKLAGVADLSLHLSNLSAAVRRS